MQTEQTKGFVDLDTITIGDFVYEQKRKSVQLSVHVDTELKKEFDELCSKLDIKQSRAYRKVFNVAVQQLRKYVEEVERNENK